MRGLLMAMSLAACTQAAPPEQTPPVPPAIADMRLSANGLGPIRIGTPIEEADALLRLVREPANPNDPSCSEWSNYRGLYVVAIDGKVSLVHIHNADLGVRTAEGIGIGSSAAEVLAAYPSAERWESEMYPEPGHELRVGSAQEDFGMSFGIGEDGRVADIGAGYSGCMTE